jgi:thiol reductant ABC exporter CydC subunit
VRTYRLISAGLAAIAGELAGIGLLSTAIWLLCEAAERPSLAVLSVAIVGVRALALGRGTLRYLEKLRSHEVALRMVAELRSRVFRGCLEESTLPKGDLLNRLVSDVDAGQDLLVRCVLPAITAVGTGTVVVASIAIFDPAAGLAAAFAVIASWLVPIAFVRSRKENGRGELAVAVADQLYGAADLTAAGAWPWMLRHTHRLGLRLGHTERSSAAVIFLQACAAVAVLLTTHLAGPVAAALAMAAFGAVGTAVPLVDAAAYWQRSLRSLRRIVALDGPLGALNAPNGPPRATVRTLRLRGVHCGYGQREVLHGVDLDLWPGRRVALTGPSGAGKTTLLKVVAGQLTPTRGTAISAGRPTNAEELAASCRGVLTDSYVFHQNIRTNLLIARPGASDEDLLCALDKAGLHVDLNSVVGEDGGQLSGGQRQRLLLARALLSDAPLLVLDEPTEGLDRETADAVMANIVAATADRAVLIATHDVLPGVFHQVLELNDGRIRTG